MHIIMYGSISMSNVHRENKFSSFQNIELDSESLLRHRCIHLSAAHYINIILRQREKHSKEYFKAKMKAKITLKIKKILFPFF